MVLIMDDGAAVPVVVTIWEGREKVVDWMPELEKNVFFWLAKCQFEVTEDQKKQWGYR